MIQHVIVALPRSMLRLGQLKLNSYEWQTIKYHCKHTELKCYYQETSLMLTKYFIYEVWTVITFHKIIKINPF